MNEEVGHDRKGEPLKIGDKVRVYGSDRIPLERQNEHLAGREGIITRVSKKSQDTGAVEVQFTEHHPSTFGGGVDGDWVILPSFCERVIEPVSICAECDKAFPSTLDYLCPGCRG
jgi:hypothetical protein